MKIVAIIQARMSSSRLPGKVLLDLAGKTVLEQVVSRVKKATLLDEVIVATSTDESDDIIEENCNKLEISCFRGSLADVLDRYYQASRYFNADYIVRITADCPLVDHEIIDEIIRRATKGEYDAYGLGGEFPDGLDCQIFKFKALQLAHSQASKSYEREHVGVFLEQSRPDLFKVGSYQKFSNLGSMRWTLDEQSDYEFLKIIFDNLASNNKDFSTNDVLKFLNENPDLIEINSKIRRNEGLEKSIREYVGEQ